MNWIRIEDLLWDWECVGLEEDELKKFSIQQQHDEEAFQFTVEFVSLSEEHYLICRHTKGRSSSSSRRRRRRRSTVVLIAASGGERKQHLRFNGEIGKNDQGRQAPDVVGGCHCVVGGGVQQQPGGGAGDHGKRVRAASFNEIRIRIREGARTKRIRKLQANVACGKVPQRLALHRGLSRLIGHQRRVCGSQFPAQGYEPPQPRSCSCRFLGPG